MSNLFDLLALTLVIVAIGLFTRPNSQGPTLLSTATKGWNTILKTVSASGGSGG